MESFDVKKAHREHYAPRAGDFALVDVPVFSFLAIDGTGDPNTAADYRIAVETLYAASYAVRLAARKELGRVHVVGPLEGLWWADDHAAFTGRDKDLWRWTMMIHQPDWITAALLETALAATAVKKPLPAAAKLRFERIAEGPSVQTLHLGPYDEEGPVIERMHEFARSRGLALSGKHHEIYLSDPRKVEAAKLRTILRQPVELAG